MRRFLWLMSAATVLALASYLPQLSGGHTASHEPTGYGVALAFRQAWPQPDQTGPNCGVSCGAPRKPASDPTVIHHPSIKSLVRADDREEGAVSLKTARLPIATTTSTTSTSATATPSSTSATATPTAGTSTTASTSNAPANLSPALKRVFTECARHEVVLKATCKSHGFPGGK